MGASDRDQPAAVATVREGSVTRTDTNAAGAFVGFAQMPASLQMMMMRYWLTLIASHVNCASCVQVARRCRSKSAWSGMRLLRAAAAWCRLTRYTVANLMFGREILWMDDSRRLAAAHDLRRWSAAGVGAGSVRARRQPAAAQRHQAGAAGPRGLCRERCHPRPKGRSPSLARGWWTERAQQRQLRM